MSSAGMEAAHILVVDDSPVDLMLITRLLRGSNYKVTAVNSVKRELETLELEKNVRMVFTDYWMPEMTGEEFLKHLKGSFEQNHIPVVIMSSDQSQTRITCCLTEGAMAYLLKPIEMSDVSTLCRRILELQRRIGLISHYILKCNK